MNVARAVHALQSFASSGLFSHERYISLVLWLWLSCLIWEGSFLCLKHTCSDQICDWNSINLCRERFSPLVIKKWNRLPFGAVREGFLQAQSEKSIRSCDLKFPSFKVTQPQQGWLEVVEVGMIRYSYDLSCTFCLSKCYTGKQTFAWVWLHPWGFFITFLSLWRDHKICPSLCSFEKKKCSTSFTCKTKGVREKEGEGRGWFWHIFSAVIMDPSHRMICSYTWLTELL